VVGLRHRGQIRLRLDEEVVGAVAGEREGVREICQLEREGELVVDGLP
jgi:hypothetical protein